MFTKAKKKKRKVDKATIDSLKMLREEKYRRLNGVIPRKREGAATEHNE